MARITYVKKAQQRYETKPVIDPATGEQKTVPVMRKDGTPKTNKRGVAVTKKVTEKDLTKPKPNLKCDRCSIEIKPGMPYKHMSIKTSTYGSRTLVRCMECPNWRIWEYRYTRSAQASRIQFECGQQIDDAGSAEDIKSIMEDAASQITELAEEAREGQENIVNGFGHDTYQSDELGEQADMLEEWARECEDWELEEPSDTCPTCEGGGTIVDGEEEEQCGDCEGTGTLDDPETDEYVDQIREEASDILNNCPI